MAKTKKDYKKLYTEVKKAQEEAMEALDVSLEDRREIIQARDRIADELVELKQKDKLRERRFNEIQKNRAYMEGQLEVLKRISGYYNEERPTRDEYKKSYKEILSSNPDWRMSIDNMPVDLPF